MSTRSTATSARFGHGHARRRPSCDHDVFDCYGGQLERRMRDLEQHWVACKNGRPAAPRHRRSRSDTTATASTPSSAVVTGAGPETPEFLFPVFRCSPRKLLCSLQQAGSSGGSADAGALDTVEDGKNRVTRRYEEDVSSVCSPGAGSPTAAVAMAASSCSCSCECTIPLCACACGYSSSSSCSGSTAATSLFSLGHQEAAVGEVRKREGARWAIGSAGRLAALGVVVLAAMAVIILELGMEDGYVEFLVPT